MHTTHGHLHHGANNENFMDTPNSGTIHKMPFGKHEGKPLADVPSRYLAWCLRETHNLEADLRDAIQAELKRRPGSDRFKTENRWEQAERERARVLQERRERQAEMLRRFFSAIIAEYRHSPAAVGALGHARDRLCRMVLQPAAAAQEYQSSAGSP